MNSISVEAHKVLTVTKILLFVCVDSVLRQVLVAFSATNLLYCVDVICVKAFY